MNAENPLEEAHRVKDELAREAGYDVGVFFDNLRKWSAENPHQGRTFSTAAELHQWAAEEEARRHAEQAPVLNDKPAVDRQK